MSALRSYEDFEPLSEWVHAEGFRTLLIHLPGFKRNQIKVQITETTHVKISGERPLDDRRWSRFVKQFPLPEHCKVTEIRAKFENGELHVRFPIAQVAPSTTMHISPSSPMEKAATELRETTQEGDGKSRKAVAEGEFLQKEQKQPEAKEEVVGHKEHSKANGDQEKKQEKLQDKEKTEDGRSNGEKKQGQQMSPTLKTDDTFRQEKETEQPESEGGEMMAKYSIKNLLMELTPDKKILLVNVAVSALVFLGIGLYYLYKREDK